METDQGTARSAGGRTEACRRWIIYGTGLLLLAMGLTLNTKAGLGVSPIISVSYSISLIWELNFGDVTFGMYGVFVALQMLLHANAAKRERRSARAQLWKDALQLPLSVVFTRFLNLFGALLPDLAADGAAASLPVQIAALLLALSLTGIGAAMSLGMRLVPNPGDGIVQAAADALKKNVGLMKNCVDAGCIVLSLGISALFAGGLTGVGIGTVLAVFLTGRVIAVFNGLFYWKLAGLAGLLPVKAKMPAEKERTGGRKAGSGKEGRDESDNPGR